MGYCDGELMGWCDGLLMGWCDGRTNRFCVIQGYIGLMRWTNW